MHRKAAFVEAQIMYGLLCVCLCARWPVSWGHRDLSIKEDFEDGRKRNASDDEMFQPYQDKRWTIPALNPLISLSLGGPSIGLLGFVSPWVHVICILSAPSLPLFVCVCFVFGPGLGEWQRQARGGAPRAARSPRSGANRGLSRAGKTNSNRKGIFQNKKVHILHKGVWCNIRTHFIHVHQ